MHLGYAFWGFCEEYKDSVIVETPDGGRFTRPIFVKELFKRGIDVVCLQQKRERAPLKGLRFSNDFPKIDALFVEWRWPTYKNYTLHPQHENRFYEPDLDRQSALLNFYSGKIPIVVWDTDLKVRNYIIKKYGKNVIWTEPSFFCKNKDFLSMPYFTDYDLELFKPTIPKKRVVYVGSNYERYWAIDKYFYNIGEKYKDIDIQFYGNWLNISPERPEQAKQIIRYSKYINFNKRNKFLDGMKIMNESICTIHLMKEEYCKYGLITPRYFESLASNCIAFIPEEFPVQLYGKKFEAKAEDIVEKIEALSKLTISQRKAVIDEQKQVAKAISPQTQVSTFVNNLWELL